MAWISTRSREMSTLVDLAILLNVWTSISMVDIFMCFFPGIAHVLSLATRCWCFLYCPAPRAARISVTSQCRVTQIRLAKCSEDKMVFIWSNYSDLTRPHPKWWFSKRNALLSGKSRLAKYYFIWPDSWVDWLVVSCFFFNLQAYLGEMIQFDLRIFFKMGWFNHQLVDWVMIRWMFFLLANVIRTEPPNPSKDDCWSCHWEMSWKTHGNSYAI